MAAQTCPQCAASNPAGSRFCYACGSALSQSAAAAPTASAPATSANAAPGEGQQGGILALLQSPAFWADVRQRAGRQIILLIGVGFFGFLDFQLHDQVLGMLVVLVIGAAITLFSREFVAWATSKVMSSTNIKESSLSWVQPLFFSVPAAIYFLLRGAGTVGSPALIGIAIAALPPAFNYFLPRFDATLKGFYETRDRLIPAPARPFLLLALSVFLTFGVIHGRLGDVDIIWGSTADKAARPDSTKVLLIAVTNVVLAYTLLRNPGQAQSQSPPEGGTA